MARRWRGERGVVGSTVVVIGLVGILRVAAFRADGYRTSELDLHDAGVWVTRGRDASLGRVNARIAQVEVLLAC